MRTRDKLAAELRKVAEIASPENAAKYEAFAKRAETGEFDDYASTYVQLYMELTKQSLPPALPKFRNEGRKRRMMRSPEGQELASLSHRL
jgi:hypothetical protein